MHGWKGRCIWFQLALSTSPRLPITLRCTPFRMGGLIRLNNRWERCSSAKPNQLMVLTAVQQTSCQIGLGLEILIQAVKPIRKSAPVKDKVWSVPCDFFRSADKIKLLCQQLSGLSSTSHQGYKVLQSVRSETLTQFDQYKEGHFSIFYYICTVMEIFQLIEWIVRSGETAFSTCSIHGVPTAMIS